MTFVKEIIFRNLTDADFFNINKHRGAEVGGGGQAYIDFPTRSISSETWDSFFDEVKNVIIEGVRQGNSWTFPVYSIGIIDGNTINQHLKVYQRRPASISITSQKIHSNSSNRVHAWHPDNGFPSPIDAEDRHQCPSGLMVYLVSTYCGEVWAGWYLNDGTTPLPFDGSDLTLFGEMFSQGNEEGYAGHIVIPDETISLDVTSINQPFISINNEVVAKKPTDSEVEGALTTENKIDLDFENDYAKNPTYSKEYLFKIKQRNKKIVKNLKELYGHTCQITGDEFLFKKQDGTNYTEAHHLVPLGEGGSDDTSNLVILGPLIHKMLHYAKVEGMDLSKIEHKKNGEAQLEISINEKTYTITWHPKHAALFKD
jgi:5-methylcytosine-specific restriction protein A